VTSEDPRGQDPDYARALRRAGDPHRRLPGEFDTGHVDDARHWSQVYAELVAFKADLVAMVEAKLRDASGDGRPELAQDLEILRAELGRLRARHEYWTHRVARLAGGESERPPE
jgi:hypothetical protein